MTKFLKTIFELVKFEHTIFALPFAFMGALIGSGGSIGIKRTLYILLAMVGARTSAMAFNRLIDASIDARNPRTRDRALPRGIISRKAVWLLILISTALFLFAVRSLNDVCFKLSPVALFLLFFYSYSKRFTSFSHFILGLVLAISPGAGFLAVNPELTLAPIILAASVLTWVAGFDIIYACQDIEFDRAEKLFSLPASIGSQKALKISRFLHFFTIIGFFMTGALIKASFPYYLAALISSLFLVYEHSLLSGGNLQNVNVAFFNVNGYVSIIMFLGTFLNYFAL